MRLFPRMKTNKDVFSRKRRRRNNNNNNLQPLISQASPKPLAYHSSSFMSLSLSLSLYFLFQDSFSFGNFFGGFFSNRVYRAISPLLFSDFLKNCRKYIFLVEPPTFLQLIFFPI